MTDTSLLHAPSVLFVHAHPDDETIATGALILDFVRRGAEVSVLTATRGERGEVVPGPLAGLAGKPELSAHRVGELERACRILGVRRLLWLGMPPARAHGLDQRSYHDSGMRWIADGVAGPSAETDPDALTAAPRQQVAADVAGAIDAVHPALVVSYDARGGYGHPDHVVIREAVLAASRDRGIPFAEVLLEPGEGAEWYELAEHTEALTEALRCHASQVSVDGSELVHSGGQRQAIPTSAGLRVVTANDAGAAG